MKIEVKDGKQLVDARELHSKLESKQEFANWIKNKVVNNIFFVENEDWVVFDKSIINSDTKQVTGGRPQVNYALTLNTAKKVAMSEQTNKGNEVRDYFISMEKKALKQLPQSFADALQLAADTQRKLEEQAPKIAVHDTITNSNKLSNVSEVAALFGMTRTTFYKWLRDNKYIQSQINKPYQKHIDKGLLDFRIDEVNGQNYYVTLITGKGITMFGHLLNEY